MRVARLPNGTTEKDLYTVEIKCQMGPDFKVEYSPINEVLKVHEGLELGYTTAQLGKQMHRAEKEIQHLDKMYAVAVSVLRQRGIPGKWPELADKFSYLDDLMRNVLGRRKQSLWGLEDFLDAKSACYDLFWYKDFDHKAYRKIPAIMGDDRIQ